MAISINYLKQLPTYVVMVIYLLSLVSCQSRNIDPEIRKQIDDFITNVYLPSAQVSKLGLGIVRDNGEIMYSTGYGLANQEKGIPIGNKTQFLMGSNTKSFTAAMIVKTLHEIFPDMGESVMDTPIRNLVPLADFTLIDRIRSETATFRDLLAHRTCISRDDLQILAEPFSTTKEIVYRQRYAEPICEHRAEFQYNNQMIIMAGELIGNLANKSYPELLGNFLKEVGMFNSALVTKSDNFSEMPYRALPYYVLDNVSYPMNPELMTRLSVNLAAGGLYVPADDMIRFMRLHLNKGRLDGKQIIPEKVLEWMYTPANILPSWIQYRSSQDDLAVNSFGYGVGMMLATYDGYEYNHHGGHFPPYRTMMSLFPKQNLGIFSSSSEGPALMDVNILHVFIFELLRGTENAAEKVMKSWEVTKGVRAEKERKKQKFIKEFLDESKKKQEIDDPSEIVGKYGRASSGVAEISFKINPATNSNELYVSYGKWIRGWLENIGGPVYKIIWDTDAVQDHYAGGDSKGLAFVKVQNKTLQIGRILQDELFRLGTFKLGLDINNQPKTPWLPENCFKNN